MSNSNLTKTANKRLESAHAREQNSISKITKNVGYVFHIIILFVLN